MVVVQVWTWYLLTVSLAVTVLAPSTPSGQCWTFVLVQLGLLAVLAAIVALTRGRGGRRRAAVAAFSLLATPTAFSSLGWVLPAVHPEPYEWVWIAWDRGLTGVDPTVALQAELSPLATEVLQWVYACFYLLPVLAIVAVGVRRGARAFDDALVTVVFCFLLSYLGYLLWPTLPPYRFLPHRVPLVGLWCFADLHAALDRAEFHRWDCFPSGHTMLSLVSLWITWRGARPWFWLLLPVVVLLVTSTMALRYHYLCDVLAGTALAPIGVALSRALVYHGPREHGR